MGLNLDKEAHDLESFNFNKSGYGPGLANKDIEAQISLLVDWDN